jgi:hypothetical protein
MVFKKSTCREILKEMRKTIDRVTEMQRIAYRKSIKAKIPIKMPKHGYVGVYEEFVNA